MPKRKPPGGLALRKSRLKKKRHKKYHKALAKVLIRLSQQKWPPNSVQNQNPWAAITKFSKYTAPLVRHQY